MKEVKLVFDVDAHIAEGRIRWIVFPSTGTITRLGLIDANDGYEWKFVPFASDDLNAKVTPCQLRAIAELIEKLNEMLPSRLRDQGLWGEAVKSRNTVFINNAG